MRYASIRSMDISNGRGVGVSLFVQGCHFHCKNCFNSDTWDFNGGKEWTKEVKNNFFKLIARPYINHISILGGEPLCKENIVEVTNLAKECKMSFPNKKIWLWSGYDFKKYINQLEITYYIDYIIDGQYIDELKDKDLIFKGSSNQKIWKKENNIWIEWEELNGTVNNKTV